MLASMAGAKLIERSISVNGIDGTEFIIVRGKAAGGLVGRSFALSATTCLLIHAEGNGATPEDPDVRRFLDTLELVRR